MNMEASEVLRLCCLLLFLASITSQNRSQNVYWLNGPMTMERDLKASDKDLSIYCYPGTSKNLFSLWQTVKFNVKINADDFEQVVAETPDRVIEKYAEERSIWNIAYRSKPSKTLPLNLFNTTCMGIQTQRWYSIELQLIRVDIWRVLLMTLGMAMIFSSRSLSENPLFFYLSGVTVGVVASFMIFVYYTSKLLPKKTLTYGILIGGWTVGVYLFQQIWENIRGLLASYQAAVFWYVAIASVVSFFVCYRIGPPRNQRSKDIVMWLLQLVGVLMIYCSSSYQEASAALVLVCLALKYFPDSLWYSMWGYWRRRFPPKPKLLSNEEYYEQGARETKRALEELRKYCSSPDCAQWRIMMKLNDSKRFASFVEGESHLNDDEVLDYESYAFSLDRDNKPRRIVMSPSSEYQISEDDSSEETDDE